MERCHGITLKKQPCKRPAIKGKNYCPTHINQYQPQPQPQNIPILHPLHNQPIKRYNGYLFLEFWEVQTEQEHPMTGTPLDDPVPRKRN